MEWDDAPLSAWTNCNHFRQTALGVMHARQGSESTSDLLCQSSWQHRATPSTQTLQSFLLRFRETFDSEAPLSVLLIQLAVKRSKVSVTADENSNDFGGHHCTKWVDLAFKSSS